MYSAKQRAHRLCRSPHRRPRSPGGRRPQARLPRRRRRSPRGHVLPADDLLLAELVVDELVRGRAQVERGHAEQDQYSAGDEASDRTFSLSSVHLPVVVPIASRRAGRAAERPGRRRSLNGEPLARANRGSTSRRPRPTHRQQHRPGSTMLPDWATVVADEGTLWTSRRIGQNERRVLSRERWMALLCSWVDVLPNWPVPRLRAAGRRFG